MDNTNQLETSFKLTYRGISYQTEKQTVKANLSSNTPNCDRYPSDIVKNIESFPRKSLDYYTYRGISYSKKCI